MCLFFLLFLFVPPSSKGGDSVGIQLRNLLSRLKTQLCWIWGSCLLSSLNPSCFIKLQIKHSVAHSSCSLPPSARSPYHTGHQHLHGHETIFLKAIPLSHGVFFYPNLPTDVSYPLRVTYGRTSKPAVGTCPQGCTEIGSAMLCWAGLWGFNTNSKEKGGKWRRAQFFLIIIILDIIIIIINNNILLITIILTGFVHLFVLKRRVFGGPKGR